MHCDWAKASTAASGSEVSFCTRDLTHISEEYRMFLELSSLSTQKHGKGCAVSGLAIQSLCKQAKTAEISPL
jgi:hypothetical protein